MLQWHQLPLTCVKRRLLEIATDDRGVSIQISRMSAHPLVGKHDDLWSVGGEAVIWLDETTAEAALTCPVSSDHG